MAAMSFGAEMPHRYPALSAIEMFMKIANTTDF
jgi:hypothetical protein